MSVATASVIARYIFLKEMDKLNKISGYNLHKGAGIEVDNQIKQIIEEKGKEYLYNIAKISFANYIIIRNSIQWKNINKNPLVKRLAENMWFVFRF